MQNTNEKLDVFPFSHIADLINKLGKLNTLVV